MSKTNKQFFEVLSDAAVAASKHPKHRLGKSQKRAHSKNGKISFTTTMTVEDYDWLVLESTMTGKSASAIFAEFIIRAKTEKKHK